MVLDGRTSSSVVVERQPLLRTKIIKTVTMSEASIILGGTPPPEDQLAATQEYP